MSFFIGVDIGTTGIRTGVYDQNFSLVGAGSGKSVIKRGSENEIYQDTDEIYAETASAVKKAIQAAGVDAGDITALSFDGQMAGILGIDQDWHAVTPYDSWLDTRCSPQVEEISSRAYELVLEKTGNIPSYNHGPKILWWKKNEPDIFRKIKKFIQPGGYVAGRLCGLKADAAFIDWTYLHFSGFADNRALTWDERLTGMFDIPVEKLPTIVSPFEIIGYTDEKESARFGLPAGVPVAAGCGDTMSCFLGTGAVQRGIAVDVAGTASVFAVATGALAVDPEGMVYFCRSVLKDLFYAMSYINGGGLNLEWFQTSFAPGKTFEQLDGSAGGIDPGSNGLIFIPHLEGRGYPNNPAMRGVWQGFTRSHGLSHFYRSILEGTAYEYALYMDRIKQLQEHDTQYTLRGVAGGAQSRVWNRIKADVLNCRYCTINREDVSILGQALIAAQAAGHISDVRDAVGKVVHITEEYTPDSVNHAVYARAVQRYRAALDHCT